MVDFAEFSEGSSITESSGFINIYASFVLINNNASNIIFVLLISKGALPMNGFITFEGIEGCGKTTQMKLLAERLTERGLNVTLTREPGGCAIADRIRAILLDAANREMVPLAELFLYAASRAQHVTEVILPALHSGNIVLCDRFTDATIAYQGYGRRLNMPLIEQLNGIAAGSIRPGLTILIDCPVETGLGRALARIDGLADGKEERFEQESLKFHHRVRKGYLNLAAAEPERFVVIDGAGTIQEVQEAVASAVLERCGSGESR
jgi:dTMP kinase